MTPKIITLSILIPSQQGRKNSGTDLGTGYGGTVCGFHTRLKYRTRPFFRPIVVLDEMAIDEMSCTQETKDFLVSMFWEPIVKTRGSTIMNALCAPGVSMCVCYLYVICRPLLKPCTAPHRTGVK